MTFKRTLFVFTSLVISFSCKKESSNTVAPVPLAALDIKNVVYASADTAQKMDVYLPAGRNTDSTKVLVLIHGGAWTSGDKSEFSDIVAYLKTQLPDYAFFNLNYRLANPVTLTNLWPAQLNDVNTAFNLIQSKSAEYAINTKKIAIFGASAGAQLALLKGYTAPTTNNVKAVVDLFGPTDLTGLYNLPADPTYPPLLTLFLSGTPTTNSANYASASPLLLVNNKVPPTIIFHGTVDNVVPIRQSDSLNLRLAAAGVTKKYVTYAGQSHGWTDLSLLVDTYAQSIAFIKANVQ